MSDARTCEHVNSASQVGCMSCFVNLAKQVEREQSRADRYEAEFSACKALLIAEQKRAERAEAERAEAELQAKEAAELWAGMTKARDAAEQRASEARAALERVQGCVVRAAHALAMALKGDGIDGADLTETTTGVSAGLVEVDAHITRALAALPVEPRQDGTGGAEPGCADGSGKRSGTELASGAALPVEPERRQVTEITQEAGTPRAPTSAETEARLSSWAEGYQRLHAGHRALLDRVASVRQWAASRINHCRTEEAKFASGSVSIEAAQERRTLAAVLRQLNEFKAEPSRRDSKPAPQNPPPSPTGDAE
jgi:hypothetical protein